MRVRFRDSLAVLSLLVSVKTTASAATLPSHEAMSVLVVADAVNPNQLSPGDLTEPADFAPALGADDSGLNLREVVTVDSQCADEALAALEGESKPSVVLYFAHRAAKLCNGGDAQTRLVTGLEDGLASGMGIVAFHHGLYGDLYTPGAKDALLQLVGAESSGINWNTTVGQRVFIVGQEHFVSSNGLTPDGQAQLAAVDGVAAGVYPYFDNIPDERYPTTELLTTAGEERVPLFATDSGGERLLGYALTRTGWKGRVVAYQPGEYQPNALDDRSGNNFQVLANALYFAAFGEPGSQSSAPPSAATSGDPQSNVTAPAESRSDATAPTDDAAESSDPSRPSPPLSSDDTSAARGSSDQSPIGTTPASESVSPPVGHGSPPIDETTAAPTLTSSNPGAASGTTAASAPSGTGGGCGCKVANTRDLTASWGVLVASFGLTWLGRRRRPERPSHTDRRRAFKN